MLRLRCPVGVTTSQRLAEIRQVALAAGTTLEQHSLLLRENVTLTGRLFRGRGGCGVSEVSYRFLQDLLRVEENIPNFQAGVWWAGFTHPWKSRELQKKP